MQNLGIKQFLTLLPALLVFLLGTVAAYTQAPRPYPFQAVAPFSQDWWLYPVENNAFKRLPVIGSNLNDVFVLPGTRWIWAVGTGGMIVHSKDGGQTWERQTIQSQPQIQSPVQQPPNQVVPAQQSQIQSPAQQLPDKGSQGSVVPPSLQPIANPELKSVFFIDEQRGWVVGTEGTILTTVDGGATWTPQSSGTTDWLNSVQMLADGRRGWVVGSGGTILTTVDGGATWKPQTSGTNAGLESVQMQADGRRGWVVGTEGTILSTVDGGANWKPQTSGTNAGLESVQMQADGRRGWVVGTEGTILSTVDGGATWTPQPSGTTANLSSVQMQADGQHGWVVGRGATLLNTRDGGKTWQDDIRYRRFPAPWYYLNWLLVAGLVAPALRQRPPPFALQTSVEDMLASDRPLEAGDPDPLQFQQIAAGLSRFLRNENTQPPLTIAISGEWGTGKSSLMNLLKADLIRRGFRPVWFNAWHHQKEEHLLAALLANIRTQAVPPWWRPEVWMFRMNLLRLRGGRHWLLVIFLLGFLSASLGGYLAADYRYHGLETFKNLPADIKEMTDRLDAITDSKPKDKADKAATIPATQNTPAQSTPAQELALLPLLVSLLAGVFSLWKGMRAFGMDPSKLLATLSSQVRLRDASAQMSFRHQFAREFRDVTEALKPRTMLILIDDLDRCRPDNVLEILEAVNFLVSSGDCYIVIGMASDRVERCIGLGFKDVAEEMIDDPEGASSGGDGGKSRRARFARQYLEKLINIEVPVPTMRTEQSIQLLLPRAQDESLQPRQQVLRAGRQALQRIWPAALLTLVVLGGFWYGSSRVQPPVLTKPVQITQPTAEKPVTPPAPTPSPGAPSVEKSLEREASSRAEFRPGQRDQPSPWFGFIPLLLVLGTGGWLLLRRLDVVVRDSPEFAAALRIWHPLVAARNNTPRSVKRFLNRVRYFAMRLCQPQDSHGWQWLLRRLRVLRPPDRAEATPPSPLPESLLVALSAIQHYDPPWLEQANLFSPEGGPPSDSGDATPEVLRQTLQSHQDRFGNWPPSDIQRQLFRELSAGIRVH